MTVRNNLTNALALKFDKTNPLHRKLTYYSIGAWAFALTSAATASVTLGVQDTYKDSVSQAYMAAMDAQIERDPGLWDVVKNVDLKGFGQSTLSHLGKISAEVAKFPFSVHDNLSQGGAIDHIKGGLANTYTMAANDIGQAAGGGEGLEIATGVALLTLGAGALAGAMIAAKKFHDHYLNKSSDAYYETRKKQLVKGSALNADIEATKLRAVDAYARLLAYKENGHEGAVTEAGRAVARKILDTQKLGGLFEKIADLVKRLDDANWQAQYAELSTGANPEDVEGGAIRDVLREVIFDTMPREEVVDPFETRRTPTPPSSPDA